MIAERLGTSWAEAGLVVASSLLVLVAAVVVIRVIGLRSFSKMSSTDFAVTIAIGSIIGGVAALSIPLAGGALAIATLLAAQAVIARYRVGTDHGAVVDNEPVVLMTKGRMHAEQLRRSRVTEHDVIAKLREANVINLDEVLVVVLETTGDVSVLHGDHELDDRLLAGVRRPVDT